MNSITIVNLSKAIRYFEKHGAEITRNEVAVEAVAQALLLLGNRPDNPFAVRVLSYLRLENLQTHPRCFKYLHLFERVLNVGDPCQRVILLSGGRDFYLFSRRSQFLDSPYLVASMEIDQNETGTHRINLESELDRRELAVCSQLLIIQDFRREWFKRQNWYAISCLADRLRSRDLKDLLELFMARENNRDPLFASACPVSYMRCQELQEKYGFRFSERQLFDIYRTDVDFYNSVCPELFRKRYSRIRPERPFELQLRQALALFKTMEGQSLTLSNRSFPRIPEEAVLAMGRSYMRKIEPLVQMRRPGSPVEEVLVSHAKGTVPPDFQRRTLEVMVLLEKVGGEKLSPLQRSGVVAFREDLQRWPPFLTVMRFENCRLEKLPDSLPVFLVELVVKKAKLKRVPATLPPLLKILDLSQNPLRSLPQLPPFLRDLRVSGCCFEEVPRLPGTLTRLDMSMNFIRRIRSPLPRSLNSVNLAGNLLQVMSASDFPGVLRLDLSDNKVERVEGPLSPALESLSLASNQMTEWTLKFSRLRFLDLQGNPFHELQEGSKNLIIQSA